MVKKIGRPKVNDDETNAVIYEGASLAQLVRLFGRDKETVTAAVVQGATPIAMRGGTPIYKVSDVAHLIVNPLKNLSDEDLERLIVKMNHADLPKMLSKEFWAGMRARQAYEEDEGDLWRTDKVIEHMGEVFKVLKQALLVGRDTVSEEVSLTPKQRDAVTRIFDGAMDSLFNAITQRFGKKEKPPKSNDEEFDL